jgi:hypothetical protein
MHMYVSLNHAPTSLEGNIKLKCVSVAIYTNRQTANERLRRSIPTTTAYLQDDQRQQQLQQRL